MLWIVVSLSLFVGFSSLIVLSHRGAWWIRAFDFPRAQFLALSAVVLALFLFLDFTLATGLLGILVVLGMGLDAYRIFRYLPVRRFKIVEDANPNQDAPSKSASGLESATLKIISSNVLQDNRQHKKLLDLIKHHQPDIFVGMEVDQWWISKLQPLAADYPYSVEVPQDNTYGLVLYSKMPLEKTEVCNFVDRDVPAIFTQVQLGEGLTVNTYVVHPRPPRPKEGPSDERDAELVSVAKRIYGKKGHFLMIGDLNDVAWSHTTRLFVRASGLRDPRWGRGLFNTFPVKYPYFRYPLDHVFVSDNFAIGELRRLGDIGSDHFPIMISVNYLNRPRKNLGEIDHAEVAEEVEEKSRRGREWEGPNERIGGGGET